MYIIFGYSLFSILAQKKKKKKKKKFHFSLIFQYCDCQNTKKNFLPHLSYLGTCIAIVKFFFFFFSPIRQWYCHNTNLLGSRNLNNTIAEMAFLSPPLVTSFLSSLSYFFSQFRQHHYQNSSLSSNS